MRFKLSLVLLFPLAALLACGSNSPAVSLALPSGDWVLNVNSATYTGSFAGSLTFQNTSVTGVFSDPCASGPQYIPVTGSINSSGTTLTLNSGTLAGGVATFTIKLPLISLSLPNYAFGTAQIVGGSCALAPTPLTANYVNYNGNFSGTLTGQVSNGTLTSQVTGQVNLSVTGGAANANGQLPVSAASISFASPTCNFSATNTLAGVITGYTMQLSSGTITVFANATSSPITLSVTGGCMGALAGTVQ